VGTEDHSSPHETHTYLDTSQLEKKLVAVVTYTSSSILVADREQAVHTVFDHDKAASPGHQRMTSELDKALNKMPEEPQTSAL
jgi:hypothetical protein